MMMYLTLEVESKMNADICSYIFTNVGYDTSLLQHLPTDIAGYLKNYSYEILSKDIDQKLLYIPITYGLSKNLYAQPDDIERYHIYFKLFDNQTNLNKQEEYSTLSEERLSLIVKNYIAEYLKIFFMKI